MKAKDMHEKTPKDIQKHIDKQRTRLAEIQREKYIKELKNVREIRAAKKQIARGLTIMTQKEREN